MGDTTIKKIDARYSPAGTMGQKHLASGIGVAMRLWEEEPTTETKAPTERAYETVGFVISGKAELESEGQVIALEPGDSWVVPKGARHVYRILEPLTAIEATHPPAHLHDRDEA